MWDTTQGEGVEGVLDGTFWNLVRYKMLINITSSSKCI